MKSNVNRELAEIQRQFRAFYEKYLCGDYSELEEKRTPYLESFCLRVVLVVMYLMMSWKFGVFSKMTQYEHLLEQWMSFLLLLLWYAWGPVRNFKKNTKELVMDKILFFWGNLFYSATPSVLHSEDVLRESLLFSEFNERKTDDCFTGEYKGVDVVVSEQELRYVSESKNNFRNVCVFRGILISFDFSKKFNGQMVVRSKGWFKSISLKRCLEECLYLFAWGILLFTAVTIMYWGLPDFWEGQRAGIALMLLMLFLLPIFIIVFLVITGKNQTKMFWKNVALEDVVFDKNWDVEATDQIEARYVLTPAFMERILEVKRRFKGNKIEFSFWKNKVLIAVHTNKDMFETTSLFTSALNYRKMQKVVAQFYSVFSVADVLLNTNKK